jgi:hypothetical protein
MIRAPVRSDYKIVQVRLPNGKIVNRRQRSPVKIKETIIAALNRSQQSIDESYVMAKNIGDFDIQGGFAHHPSVIDADD